MRIALNLAAPLIAAFVATAGFAGGAECAKAAKAAHAANVAEKHCTMSAEECKQAMAEMKTHGWLGVELDKSESDGALVVTKVLPQSPAAFAGFKTGDVLVAINGVAYDKANEAKLKEVKKGLQPGDQATWTIRRAGSEQKISAKLGRMPDEVYNAYVSEHMKEHAVVAQK